MKSFKHGFTLIELLVVIAIIAILAAILFPVFLQAKMQAQKATCASNLKQMSSAVMLYVQDSNGTYPSFALATADDPPYFGFKVLARNIKNTNVLRCPSKKKVQGGYFINHDYTLRLGPSGYINEDTLFGMDVTGVNYGVPVNPPAKESKIVTPTRVIMLADTTPLSRGAAFFGYFYFNIFMPPAHDNGSNFAFCDGHVKFYDLTNLPWVPPYGLETWTQNKISFDINYRP